MTKLDISVVIIFQLWTNYFSAGIIPKVNIHPFEAFATWTGTLCSNNWRLLLIPSFLHCGPVRIIFCGFGPHPQYGDHVRTLNYTVPLSEIYVMWQQYQHQYNEKYTNNRWCYDCSFINNCILCWRSLSTYLSKSLMEFFVPN